MSLSFGQIILYSKDPAKLFHFISYLFDVEAKEVNLDEGFLFFDMNNVNFKIVRLEKGRIEAKPIFSLQVNSPKELAELKQSLEFFYYKEGISKSAKITLNDDCLSFKDPDGRSWEIDCVASTNIAYQQQKNNISNVRIY